MAGARTHVALLRAINVGGRNALPMFDAKLATTLTLRNLRTVGALLELLR